MKKALISLTLLLIAVLLPFFLRFIPIFNVAGIDAGPFYTAEVERQVKRALGRSFFSPYFSQMKEGIEALSYVEDMDIRMTSFMDFDIEMEYKDGIILTDFLRSYFFDGNMMYLLDPSRDGGIGGRYLHFEMSSEMLDYYTSYYAEPEEAKLLSLLIDISSQNIYNGGKGAKVDYLLPASSDFGELRLYGTDGSILLSIKDFSNPSFILKSIESISSLEEEPGVSYEIFENTLIRRSE